MDEGKEITKASNNQELSPANPETPIPMGPVLYFDRRIWNYYKDPRPDGTPKTTVDYIKDLVGREDLKDSDVKVIDPEVHENIEDVLNRMRPLVGMTMPVIVIPNRAKFYNEMDGHTVWLDVNPQPFQDVGKKYNVPVYQLGKGRLWPPLEGQENALTEHEEDVREKPSLRRKLLGLIKR